MKSQESYLKQVKNSAKGWIESPPLRKRLREDRWESRFDRESHMEGGELNEF